MLLQVVKGIDAVTREELARIVMTLGLQRFDPILNSFALPGFRRHLSLVPTVTKEDEVVLNNMRRVVAFLSSGSPASRSISEQVRIWVAVRIISHMLAYFRLILIENCVFLRMPKDAT